MYLQHLVVGRCVARRCIHAQSSYLSMQCLWFSKYVTSQQLDSVNIETAGALADAAVYSNDTRRLCGFVFHTLRGLFK